MRIDEIAARKAHKAEYDRKYRAKNIDKIAEYDRKRWGRLFYLEG